MGIPRAEVRGGWGLGKELFFSESAFPGLRGALPLVPDIRATTFRLVGPVLPDATDTIRQATCGAPSSCVL